MRLCDDAVLVDHVCDAAGVFVRGLFGGAVGEAEFVIGVAEEREGEVELLREGGVLLLRVEADAEDDGVLCVVLRDEVPEPGTLDRSAGCVGLRIKPEHDLFAAQVAQADRVAVVVGGLEIGGRISGLQHVRTSSERYLEHIFELTAERHWYFPRTIYARRSTL